MPIVLSIINDGGWVGGGWLILIMVWVGEEGVGIISYFVFLLVLLPFVFSCPLPLFYVTRA